jgi:hypothetical protein
VSGPQPLATSAQLRRHRSIIAICASL